MDRPFQQRMLEALEHLALASHSVQAMMLGTHEKAFRRLKAIKQLDPRHILIVGGGMFPRTAIICARVWPHSKLTVIDSSQPHLALGTQIFSQYIPEFAQITWIHDTFSPDYPFYSDLVIFPLAFSGSQSTIIHANKRAHVLKHAWLWPAQAHSVCIALWLLKQLVYYPKIESGAPARDL